MERYLVFAGETYYAKGGMHDFQGSFNNLPSAMEFAVSICDGYRIDWYHVVDSEDATIIAASEQQAHGAEYQEFDE